MKMFEEKKVSRQWSKHTSFTYVFKGDFNYNAYTSKGIYDTKLSETMLKPLLYYQGAL